MSSRVIIYKLVNVVVSVAVEVNVCETVSVVDVG